jgi:hypothetical protein
MRNPESNFIEKGDCFGEVKIRAWNNSAMEWRGSSKAAEKI